LQRALNKATARQIKSYKKQKQTNQSNILKNHTQQPKPRPSHSAERDAGEKLNAMADKDRETTDRLLYMRSSSSDNPEKDW